MLVDAPRDGEALEKALGELEKPLPGDARTDLDPATWGMSPEALAAQDRLLGRFGG